MRTTLSKATILFVIAIVSLAGGCKSFNLKKNIPWDEKSDVPEKQVVNLIATWSEAALNKPGQPPMRGFGGRVYFYNRFDEPVTVDGNLVVYAYENRSVLPSDAPPDRKFVITSDQLATHYSPGPMGPSYSIWLPWDELGGDQKDVDLVPTFVPKIGQVVVGVQARQRLPGSDSLAKSARQSQSGRATSGSHTGPVMPVAYRESEDSAPPSAYRGESESTKSGLNEKRTEVTTIAVPEVMRKRMAMSWNQPMQASNAEQPAPAPIADGAVRQYETYRAAMSALQDNPPPGHAAAVSGRDSRLLAPPPDRPSDRVESRFDAADSRAPGTPFASRPTDPRPWQRAQKPWPPGPAPYYHSPGQGVRDNQATGYWPPGSNQAAGEASR